MSTVRVAGALGARVRRAARRLPPVAWAAEATRTRRERAAVAASGWFDADWYREQAGPRLPVGADPLDHYLEVGSARGWQPHPLFDPGYYLANSPTARRSRAEPFAEFVRRGARRGDDPHPLFDTAAYLERVPRAADHPGGAFGHFLAGQEPTAVPSRLLQGLVPAARAPGDDPYLALVRRAGRAHAAVPDHTGFPRSYPTFDHARARDFVTRMRRHAAGLSPPLVSVVLPTRDRAAVLPRAIDSVLGQTHGELELLVVDDGSEDDTAAVVGAYDDPRLRYLPQAGAGVSVARNRALAQARGELVAYLDSDNAWVPEFLEVMVAVLDAEGARAAYAGAELRGDEGVEYRGGPLHREALRERNYIDLNTLVHERSLLDEIGTFDERLRRVVDWELILRLVDAVEPVYAPFLGVHYDASERDTDRITSVESIGYRHVVRHRHLVAHRQAPEPVAGRTSVLLAAPHGGGDLAPAVRDLLEDRGGDLEVVAVDNGGTLAQALRLRALAEALGDLRVERVADPTSLAVAVDLAATRASGDVLVVLDPATVAAPDQLRALAGAVRAGEADLAQPTLLEPSGRILSTGQRLGPGGVPIALGGELAEGDATLEVDRERDAVHGHAFAVAAAWFRRLGGLDPLFVRGGADLDLSLRLRAVGGRVRWVPGAAVVVDPRATDHRWVPSYPDQRELRRTHPAPGPATLVPGEPVGALRVGGFRVGLRTQRPGPKLYAAVYERRPAARGPRRWAIKATAPNVAERHRWGDWHFAQALARALRRLGQHVVVDCRESWYRPTGHLDDVVLAVRGTRPYEPAPGQTNLVWLISHPELVEREWLAAFDHRFVASQRFAERLAVRWSELSVEALPQCTDPEVFYPDPDPALREEVLFVGNSRGRLRTVVADALAAGLEPAIHGAGWEGLVPDRLIRGHHVSNAELRRHYSSAGVVLNDHWEDMRRAGFVSNRVFDALACGARVVTDPVDGLPEAPPGRLRTYADADDLRRVVEELLSAPEPARDGAEGGAAGTGHGPTPAPWPALAEHTFEARARALVAAAEERTRPRRSLDGP